MQALPASPSLISCHCLSYALCFCSAKLLIIFPNIWVVSYLWFSYMLLPLPEMSSLHSLYIMFHLLQEELIIPSFSVPTPCPCFIVEFILFQFAFSLAPLLWDHRLGFVWFGDKIIVQNQRHVFLVHSGRSSETYWKRKTMNVKSLFQKIRFKSKKIYLSDQLVARFTSVVWVYIPSTLWISLLIVIFMCWLKDTPDKDMVKEKDISIAEIMLMVSVMPFIFHLVADTAFLSDVKSW